MLDRAPWGGEAANSFCQFQPCVLCVGSVKTADAECILCTALLGWDSLNAIDFGMEPMFRNCPFCKHSSVASDGCYWHVGSKLPPQCTRGHDQFARNVMQILAFHCILPGWPVQPDFLDPNNGVHPAQPQAELSSLFRSHLPPSHSNSPGRGTRHQRARRDDTACKMR